MMWNEKLVQSYRNTTSTVINLSTNVINYWILAEQAISLIDKGKHWKEWGGTGRWGKGGIVV